MTHRLPDILSVGCNMPRYRYQQGSLERVGTKGKRWKAHWFVYETAPDGTETRKHRSQVLGPCAEISKAEAQEKLADLIRYSKENKPRMDSSMPLRDFIETVYLPTKTPTWEHNTRVNAESIIRRHILPVLGDSPIGEVRKVDVVQLVAGMKAAGYGRSTINQTSTRLQSIFEEAVANNVLASTLRNPAARIENPVKASRKVKPTLSIPEVRQLFHSVTGRTHTLFSLLILCGLRIGEALALRWDDVQGQNLRVDESADPTGVKCTKTDTDRLVPLTVALAQELALRKSETVYDRPEDFIFCARDGHGPIAKQTAHFNYQAPAKKASGLEKLDFRICRRTFATLVKAYAHTVDVQHILGHSTPRTTEQHYIQPVAESQQAAVLALESAISGELYPSEPQAAKKRPH